MLRIQMKIKEKIDIRKEIFGLSGRRYEEEWDSVFFFVPIFSFEF